MDRATAPRVCDNDRDEITVTLDGKEIRGWSYETEAERRVKMLAAREFCEGWFQAIDQREQFEDFADYDAGLLNDFGAGNVEYLRAEIGRANDFWRGQVASLQPPDPR